MNGNSDGDVSWLQNVLDLRQERVQAIEKLESLRKSSVFVYWNLDELSQEDFFSLADALEEENPIKDVDLVLLSPGGNGEAGYRIGHSFQQWTERRQLAFRVIVPLYAKSAATILALGSDQIVMGLHSELGPIDPQIPKYDRARERWRYIPALSVFDGLKLVSEYLTQIPQMTSLFEQIIRNEQLTLDDLGLLERARESGKQYGERLLSDGMKLPADDAREVAEKLSDYYKFHGHPIDAFEAEHSLKLNILYSEGEEWEAIKDLRDAFQRFVGQPGIMPGSIVVSAIETASLRSWRYQPLQGDSRRFVQALETEMRRGDPTEV
jgi:hypothetical protein